MKKKTMEFRSMDDLKDTFFPADKNNLSLIKENVSDFGIELSKESLEKIKIKISRL